MLIKIKQSDGKKIEVDVSDKSCATATCFSLGQDKGTFVQGRGYTSYHAKPRWVCMRRHLHGCPDVEEREVEE